MGAADGAPEYEANPSNLYVVQHLITGLALASRARRQTSLVFVTTREAHRAVLSQLTRALAANFPERDASHWPGARLHLRVTSWRAASTSDPLTVKADLDRHIIPRTW